MRVRIHGIEPRKRTAKTTPNRAAEGFGGIITGEQLTAWTAAWRHFNETGSLEMLYESGLWEREDGDDDEEDDEGDD